MCFFAKESSTNWIVRTPCLSESWENKVATPYFCQTFSMGISKKNCEVKNFEYLLLFQSLSRAIESWNQTNCRLLMDGKKVILSDSSPWGWDLKSPWKKLWYCPRQMWHSPTSLPYGKWPLVFYKQWRIRYGVNV